MFQPFQVVSQVECVHTKQLLSDIRLSIFYRIILYNHLQVRQTVQVKTCERAMCSGVPTVVPEIELKRNNTI